MNRHNYGLLLPIVISVLLLGFNGCKKNKDAVNPATLYDFSYSGLLIANDTISFTSTAPGGSTFLWDFGDSSSSSSPTPYHIYSHSDSFVVKLTINGDTLHSIVKKIPIGINPGFTYLVAGLRLWHHSFLFVESIWDTTYYYPDTSFAVNYINPITISIGTDTLYYSYSLDSNLYFTRVYFIYADYVEHPTGSEDDLKFNHISNQIIFSRFDHISAGGNSTDIYNSP